MTRARPILHYRQGLHHALVLLSTLALLSIMLMQAKPASGRTTNPYHSFSLKLVQRQQRDAELQRKRTTAGSTRKLDEPNANATTSTIEDSNATNTTFHHTQVWNPDVKEMKICNIMGGLDLTRLRSFRTRALFKDGIEDVELMREVVTESMYNGGLAGGLSNLEQMAASLDWQARQLRANETTLSAGMGWVDDRPNRRMERQVTTPDQPYVGDKQADAAFSDTLSNILPWIRDRRAKENNWYASHQNGRTQGISKAPLDYDSLYIGVWIVTPGDAIFYYPPMSAFAHPYTFSDIVGGNYSWRVYPAEPEAWPFHHTVRGGNIKDALYDLPYADVAHPGLSMISAMAPVYYTGEWFGYSYNDTFIAAVGVDIALDSIANVLRDLEDSLAQGSFALVVAVNSFDVVAMSQSVVDKIYPERTGMEELRVTYDDVDGSIVEDRRNQTYTVSDAIWQGLLDGVESADWQHLYEQVQATELGGRGYTEFNVTVRGRHTETYYAMFDRWDSVAEWAVLVLVPVQGVERAIQPEFSTSLINLNAIQGEQVSGRLVLTNQGTLNFVVSPMVEHSGIRLEDAEKWRQGVVIKPGENVLIHFVVNTTRFGVGNTTVPVSFLVQDDGYPDCLHSGDISFQISLRVTDEPNLNQLGMVRIVGLLLCAIVLTTSLLFKVWVIWNRHVRVIAASQPFFLLLICIGCCVMGSTIVPLSIDDAVASVQGCNIACMSAPWLLSMGFVVTFSALFSKIYRVNQIFRAKFKRIILTEKDVMKPFFVMFTLNFVVLLAWTLVDPLKWIRIPLGDDGDSYGACRPDGNEYLIFLILVGAINVLALCLACYQAYCAREISDEFSETKYIAVAIVGMLQVLVVGLPLLFIVHNNPTAQYFMEAAILFVFCMAVLLLIFVPKMIYIRDYAKHRRAREIRSLADTMYRANHSTGADSGTIGVRMPAESDASTGVLVTSFGTASLQKDNDELRKTVSKLRELLEQHDILYQDDAATRGVRGASDTDENKDIDPPISSSAVPRARFGNGEQ